MPLHCYRKTRRLLLDAGIIDLDNKEFDEKKASDFLKELKNKESL